MMKLNSIHKVIKRSKRILISTHVNPDLDALCCELVMAAYLRSLGKKVIILNAQKAPSMYGFIKGISQVRTPGIKKISYDAAIIFDCGDLNRIGRVQEFLDTKYPIINIDHHATNTFFGQYHVVRQYASSTAEVLFDILKDWKVPLSKQMAEWIYLGILTDTGSFRYQSTSAYTHVVAAELLLYGIKPHQLYKKVYEEFLEKDFHGLLALAEKFSISHKGRVAMLCLNKKQTKVFGDRIDLRHHLFRFLQMIKGVQVMVIFTEANSKLTRVNFRSTAGVNVAKVASHFGGGGHRAASGCRVGENIKASKEKVLREVQKVLLP